MFLPGHLSSMVVWCLTLRVQGSKATELIDYKVWGVLVRECDSGVKPGVLGDNNLLGKISTGTNEGCWKCVLQGDLAENFPLEPLNRDFQAEIRC